MTNSNVALQLAFLFSTHKYILMVLFLLTEVGAIPPFLKITKKNLHISCILNLRVFCFCLFFAICLHTGSFWAESDKKDDSVPEEETVTPGTYI